MFSTLNWVFTLQVLNSEAHFRFSSLSEARADPVVVPTASFLRSHGSTSGLWIDLRAFELIINSLSKNSQPALLHIKLRFRACMARALAVGFVPQQHHFPGIFFKENTVWSAEEKAGLSHPVFGLKYDELTSLSHAPHFSGLLLSLLNLDSDFFDLFVNVLSGILRKDFTTGLQNIGGKTHSLVHHYIVQ